MAKQLLLIDGNSIVFRAFFAMHNQIDKFTNKDGLHTAAIYGFKLMLDHVLENFHPDAALVAFDAGKVTFRTKMYGDYKGGRSKTPEELTEQLPYVRELVKDSGLHSYELKGYEADDIIGTLAKEGDAAGYETLIVTGDRDLTQLASEHTTVAVTHKGVTDTEHYTPEHVQEKLGITPAQIIDMKALMGDTSDNYPGVTKIGEKTAIKLVKQFGSVEGIYENIDELKKSKMKEHLVEEEEIARQCKTLATILRDAPIEVKLADLEYHGPQTEKLIDFYQKMDFQSFLKKMAVSPDDQEPEIAPIKYTELTADNLDLIAKLGDRGSFYLEMPDPNYHTSPFAGFALGNDEQWLVSRDPELLKAPEVQNWLTNSKIKKDVFNAKAQIVGLNRLGISLDGIDFDLLLASYLLNTNDNSNDLGKLAHEHGYDDVQTDEEVYGKGAKRTIPDDDQLFFQHLANKARAIEQLRPQLFEQLEKNEQLPLYTDIELPLTHVLAKMEITGVHVDAQTLKNMGSKLTERLTEIEEQIYQEAGEEFNINSTKQLGKILFEKLKLPVIKKTKTGYSTAVDVLEKLAPQAPIVENILQYRQISKLQSTYIKGLLKVIHSSDQKIHTRYLQTLTQTGRLSSVDPNLQNIPVRLPEGRLIRQAFVPSHEGWQIFSSDYSQVELRVLAHITGDHNLQEDFKNGEDIHASTARRIFHLKPDQEIDRNMRRRAKAVNFGIVYGISAFGLSEDLSISRKEAMEYIEHYFNAYPGIKAFLDRMVEQGHTNEYVTTMFGRRRPIPEIKSSNYMQRQFGERIAMNSPIQGTAADIMKIAMTKVNKRLKEEKLQSRIVLQVHDELLLEVPTAECEAVKTLLVEQMQSAANLRVPLEVSVSVGNSWYETK